ncbi:MAG: SLBB domain-containing protein [Candidatus Sericytochromatia bacterium]|nr:SLBB domain-containing protein [Candidatus Sericytochromatia bacterium]
MFKNIITIAVISSLIFNLPVFAAFDDEINQQKSLLQKNFNVQPNNFLIQKSAITNSNPEFINENPEPLKNYKLCIGDSVQIHLLSRDIELEYTLEIGAEGKIFIPKIGEFLAYNLTTDQLNNKIKSKIFKRLKEFELSVLLIKIHQIKVFMTGYALKPGVYQITYDTRLMDFLRQIEGITENGSLRNIEVSSKNSKKTYDLFNFIYKGNIEENPKLKTGDKVYIPYINKRITVIGNALKPGIYEFKDKDNLLDIIKLAGGLGNAAAVDKITLWKNGMNYATQSSNQIDLKNNVNLAENKLNDGDVIYIPTFKQPQEDLQVYIYGQINRAGTFPFKEGTKFSDYIKLAGGANSVADLEKVKVTRIKNINGKPVTETFIVDANDIIYNGNIQKDFFISANDVIFIPERFFNFRNFTDITGVVLSSLGIISLVISFINKK